jgi:hypothetical protein
MAIRCDLCLTSIVPPIPDLPSVTRGVAVIPRRELLKELDRDYPEYPDTPIHITRSHVDAVRRGTLAAFAGTGADQPPLELGKVHARST